MMPSLFRYFTVVGGLLVAGLIGVNAVLEPGGPGVTLVKNDAAKPVVRHDPRASLVERLRDEEAAQKAAANGTPAAAITVAKAPVPAVAAAPVAIAAVAAAPEPAVQPVAAVAQSVEPAQTTAPAALTGVPTDEEAARAVRAAQDKIKAEKARKTKAKLARDRAKAQEADSRMQDQIYYAQRQQVAQSQGYAFAPRPTFGPFGQGGGWGRGF